MHAIVRINKKAVGEVCQDIYISQRTRALHFYRLGMGYPISSKILSMLKEMGVRRVVIVEKSEEGMRSYAASLEQYLQAPEFTMGFDAQKCVSLKEMVVL